MSFTTILNLSLSASWLVLAIALLRLLLKKAPKALHCALWALVAIRLLCPVSIESGLSLIPTREVVPSQYLTAEPGAHIPMDTPAKLEIVTNPVYDTPVTVDTDTTIDRLQMLDLYATVVWLGGMGAMGIYALYSYLSLRLRVRMAGWLSGNVYECDEIDSPFILGLLRPRIYLPGGLDEITKVHVLAHENAHLKRLDHLWKPLGFTLLAIHWFNPVMWLGYCLLCRDIELACDEAVIRKLDRSSVRSYSEALIECTISHRCAVLCPLAFGEVGVKGRIKAMLHYKKPGFRVMLLALVASVVLAVCFLTDPLTPVNTLDEILSQKNCMVLSVEEKTIKLQINKTDLPENVLNGKTHRFDDAPILLQEYDNTRFYITEARMSGDELLVTIDARHDLPNSGSILLPWHPFDDGAGKDVHTAHGDVMDAVIWYGNALVVREKGRSAFSVGIKMEVWNRAQEYVRFQLEGLYNLRYHFNASEVSLSNITAENGYILTGITPVELSIELPLDVPPYTLHEDERRTYTPEQYSLWQTDTTTVYLRDFYYRADYGQYVYVIDFAYDLPVSGSVLVPYEPVGDGSVRRGAYLVPDSIGDDVSLQGQGPGAQLDIHVNRSVHEQLQVPLSVTICGIYALDYRPAEHQRGVVDTTTIYTLEADPLVGPRFQLNPDGTFHFSENPLSSYLGVGAYTLRDNRLIMKTDDGNYTWAFDLKDGSFFFDAEASSTVLWYPDLRNLQPIPDGARFIQSPIYTNEVEILLASICSSPAQSSNPGEYIREHAAEYSRLMDLGQDTVRFCFQEFARGHQTDLRGYIMALVCQDIIRLTVDPSEEASDLLSYNGRYMTGQEWFDDFANHALAHRETPGVQEYTAFHIWYSLALEILGI